MFNKLSQWIILGLLLIAPIVLVVTYVNEFLAADSALDSGASYDYQTGQADFLQNHPYISFSKRHGVLLTVASLSYITAIAYGLVMHFRRDIKKHADQNVADINGML